MKTTTTSSSTSSSSRSDNENLNKFIILCYPFILLLVVLYTTFNNPFYIIHNATTRQPMELKNPSSSSSSFNTDETRLLLNTFTINQRKDYLEREDENDTIYDCNEEEELLLNKINNNGDDDDDIDEEEVDRVRKQKRNIRLRRNNKRSLEEKKKNQRRRLNCLKSKSNQDLSSSSLVQQASKFDDKDISNKSNSINNIQTNDNILPVTLEELQSNVHVHIRTKGRKDNQGCGGCMILWELYDELAALNISLSTEHDTPKEEKLWCPKDDFFNEPIQQNKTIIFVYPEVDSTPCNDGPGRRVHVHWLLSPLGFVAKENIYESWNDDDLVFSYSSACAAIPNIPVSNILQVLRNPQVGDETDISKEQFFDQSGRDGLLWMFRKALPYKDHLNLIHEQVKGVTNNSTIQIERPHPNDFMQHKYFVTYDPFTFYTYIAAMLGTVSIVNPLENITKRKWAEGSYVGEYVRANGGLVPGVAYGIDDSELEFAERTMPDLREYMFKVKAWGQSTVPRFLRDGYRYSLGERKNFEGAMFVKDAFPDDKDIGESWVMEYMESHEHDGKKEILVFIFHE